MTKFESSVKLVPFPQTRVFDKLADLSNLSALAEQVNNPDFVQMIQQQANVDSSKLEQAKDMLNKLEFTTDSVSIKESPLGAVGLQIVERIDPKTIKYEVVNAPVAGNLWIQILPTSPNESKIKCTIGAELNFFMKQMAKKPLQEGVEKLAEMLAMLPY